MSNNLQQFLSAVVEAGGHRSERRLKNHVRFMLGDVSGVERALDIGGGSGAMSFYVASQGADEVICLEPEGHGSTNLITKQFHRLQERVPHGDRVLLVRERIQSYEPGQRRFDLIMSFNAINHLDEEACIDLTDNGASYDRYIALFRKLYEMTTSGGRIVITDCSRYNFFQLIKLKNPMMPTIEWHKHQSPYLWTSMLAEVGFVRPRIQWTSYNVLGAPGRLLMGNVIANYLTLSHFKFTMYKP